MRARVWGLGVLLLTVSSLSAAQEVAPPPAPPPAQPAPAVVVPTYVPQYAPPPPPPAPRPPGSAYRVGDPIPLGYHPEERARMGFVTAGILLTGIPYLIGVLSAVGADYSNKSGWLAAPWVGPWMTLGQRRYVCDVEGADTAASKSLKCVGETFAIMGLIVDGVLQAGGAALLLVGALHTKTVLVRDEQAIHFTPMRIGSGYGAGLSGTF